MSGPQPKPPHLKAISGTTRKDRAARQRAIEPPPDVPPAIEIPPPPDWLGSAHAVNEWNRVVPILTEAGMLNGLMLTPLAHYCALHGRIVTLTAAGAHVQTSATATLAKMASDLGLTYAAQSRGRSPDGPKPNKFSNNGRRKT